jgi:acetyltransferase-like isoleucine patch superfamily enzyme
MKAHQRNHIPEVRWLNLMASTIALMMSIGLLPSFLKVRYYRWRGAKIGKGVHLGLFSLIQANHIEIGNHSRIGMLVRIKARDFRMGAYSQIRQSTSVIAPRIYIGNETIIMSDVVIGGMESWDSQFRIGDRCTVFQRCFINPTRDIIIGNDVGIGGANYLFTHGSWSNALEGFPIDFGPINIEDRVWLPWRVFVLPNVTIGHDSVIAAGSVVSRSIPPLSLAAGSPAKVLRSGIEFVRCPSVDEKVKKLEEWFREFPRFLKLENLYIRSGTIIPTDAEGILFQGTIESKENRDTGTIILATEVTSETLKCIKGVIFLITLESASEDVKDIVGDSNGAWFDLSMYQWMGNRNRIANEIRAFFARFGVRFESLDLLPK